jgi:hypothetical protein
MENAQMKPRTEAQARRDQALDWHEVSKQAYLKNARWGAMKIAQKKGVVSVNEVRIRHPLPEDMHPSVMGAVFRDPQFEHTGTYTRATHPASHARLIGIYKLRKNK